MKFIYTVLAALFLVACSGQVDADLKNVVDTCIGAMNKHDSHTVWANLSEGSQRKVAAQLNQNKQNLSGRTLLVDSLKIPPSQIDTLSPEDYFAALMTLGQVSGVDTVVTKIAQSGDKAKIQWEKGEKTGTSYFVKEAGGWKADLDHVEGQ